MHSDLRGLPTGLPPQKPYPSKQHILFPLNIVLHVCSESKDPVLLQREVITQYSGVMIRWLCSNALIQTATSYRSKSSAAGNSAGLILSKGKPPLSKRKCRRPHRSGEPAKLALPGCSSAEGHLKYYTAYREAEGGCWNG